MVLWLTGLPGSGKSELAEEFKRIRPEFLILRMDEFRKIVTPNPTYSDVERDIVYRSLVFQAKMLSDLGHSVIIDATGNRRKWRMLARELIGDFREVWVKCPLQVCRERESGRTVFRGAPSGIYAKSEAGAPVPGVGTVYEEPEHPDIVVDTESLSARSAARLLAEALE